MIATLAILTFLGMDTTPHYRPLYHYAPPPLGRSAYWVPRAPVIPRRPPPVEVTVRRKGNISPGPVLPSRELVRENVARSRQRAYYRCLMPRPGSWDDLSLEVLCDDRQDCRKRICEEERDR